MSESKSGRGSLIGRQDLPLLWRLLWCGSLVLDHALGGQYSEVP